MPKMMFFRLRLTLAKSSFKFLEISEVTTDSAAIIPRIVETRFLSKGLDKLKNFWKKFLNSIEIFL